MKNMQMIVPVIFSLLIPASTFAVDGVIEINHTCAVHQGCFSGDTAGYPVLIDGVAGKSYKLTSDLIVPDEFTTGIEMGFGGTFSDPAAVGITIDLNGFEIIRAACVGYAVACIPESGGLTSGYGINAPSSTNIAVTVRNGSITGMGNHGVFLNGVQSEVNNVKTRWNRKDGIYLTSGGTVRNSISYENGDDGVSISYGGRIIDSLSHGNGDDGVTTLIGSSVINCSLYSNGDDGINAGSGSSVFGNTVYNNNGDGIQASDASRIQQNTVYRNDGYGLNFEGKTAAYKDNVVTTNLQTPTGLTVVGGISFGVNVCDGDIACPPYVVPVR